MENLILSRFKEGDAKAFEAIYRHYWRKVLSFTHLYIRSSSEVEDVVQEVFIKLWETRAQLDLNKSFDGYLFILTRNLIFNRLRGSLNEEFFELTVVEAMASATDVEEEVAAADLSERIDTLLLQLTPRQQEVYRLSRKDLLNYTEIAKRLHISERTVEKHLSDVVHYLREHLLHDIMLNELDDILLVPVFCREVRQVKADDKVLVQIGSIRIILLSFQSSKQRPRIARLIIIGTQHLCRHRRTKAPAASHATVSELRVERSVDQRYQ